MARCPYGKCKGEGLIPFIGSDGKTRNDTFHYCDCHPIYGVNAHVPVPLATQGNRPGVGSRTYKQQRGRLHLYPDDFDFPMSYSVYRSLCQQHGFNDPGPDRLDLESPKPTPEIEPEWSRQQWQSVKQLRAMVNHLNHQITKLRAEKREGDSKPHFRSAI